MVTRHTVVDDAVAEDPHEYAVGEAVTLTGETAEHFGVVRFRTTDKIWVAARDLNPQPRNPDDFPQEKEH